MSEGEASENAKSRRDVILIGGSQGSISAIKRLLAKLPLRFPAAIGITLHRSPTFVSTLAELFAAHTQLPVVEPRDGQLFERGIVYLAPRDHHMVFGSGAVWLDRGPKHHFARPAVDVMFTSGAATYGARVIGVLLTGNLSDGVAGLVHIKEHGGLSLAQDPAEAEAPSMPTNAVVYDDVDVVFRIDCVAGLLSDLVEGKDLASAASRNEAQRLRPSSAPAPHGASNGVVWNGGERTLPAREVHRLAAIRLGRQR